MARKKKPRGAVADATTQANASKISPQAAAFEKALDAVEAHERPPEYEGFTARTRKEASASQFLTFAQQYAPDWRHTKIRLYRMLLEDRARVVEHERERLVRAGLDPRITVYQDVTNGLIASAASEFCQSAEDLAVLAHACNSDDFFARDIASASAGRMQEEVKRWAHINLRDAASVLRVPWFEPADEWKDTPVGQGYLQAVDRSAALLREVGRMYRTWQLHFFKYKHGLQLALRYGQAGGDARWWDDFIARREATTRGFPVAYDCGSIGQALDDPTSPQSGLILPDIGPGSTHVRWNARHLAQERNLLRHVFPPGDAEPDIQEFERAASYVAQAQRVVLFNRSAELRPDAEQSYFVPAEDPAAVLRIARRRAVASTPPGGS